MGMALAILGVPAGPGAGGVSAPANTVAPAIAATAAIIGTEIAGDDGTWTPTPDSYTYQWQRYTGGAWANITGATNKNYTPVAADFGLTLRLVVTATTAGGSTAANSNATAETVVEAFTQALGAELLQNPAFANWTGDDPDNWTVGGESGSDPMVTQVAADGSAGTGAARLYSSATADQPRMHQNAILTATKWYEVAITVSALTSGKAILRTNPAWSANPLNPTGAGVARTVFRSPETGVTVQGSGAAPHDFVIDAASTKLITLNAQQTMPSADATLIASFTLPGSPAAQDIVLLAYRIAEASLEQATPNYWRAQVSRNVGNTAWEFYLYSVLNGGLTTRVSVADVGTPDGIKIVCNGTSHTCYTRQGGVWTQRGAAVVLDHVTANTGINLVYTSVVTPVQLSAVPL